MPRGDEGVVPNVPRRRPGVRPVPRGKGAIARSRAACLVALRVVERATLTADLSAQLRADCTATRIETQHVRAICDELRHADEVCGVPGRRPKRRT